MRGFFAALRMTTFFPPQTIVFVKATVAMKKVAAVMRELAEMHEVPIVGKAVGAGVLAHRTDADAITALHLPKIDRREQWWLGHT